MTLRAKSKSGFKTIVENFLISSTELQPVGDWIDRLILQHTILSKVNELSRFRSARYNAPLLNLSLFLQFYNEEISELSEVEEIVNSGDERIAGVFDLQELEKVKRTLMKSVDEVKSSIEQLKERRKEEEPVLFVFELLGIPESEYREVLQDLYSRKVHRDKILRIIENNVGDPIRELKAYAWNQAAKRPFTDTIAYRWVERIIVGTICFAIGLCIKSCLHVT